jgi:putative transposase
MSYQFMSTHCPEFTIDEMCECLEVSRSGYYAWKEWKPCARTLEDGSYKDRIRALHKKAKGRYGHRPIHEHLKDEEVACGRDRTLRLMKELGIEGIQKKGFKPLGTNSNHQFGYSPNLLKELGAPIAPDQIWVADTTYLKTRDGWSYLATVMDLFSRRILGWHLSTSNDATLVCQALRTAVLTRGGKMNPDLIHHSDRGSTYASYEYQKLLSSLTIRQSMSAKGNCYDNAAMESFYGRYKTSSVRGRVFDNDTDLRSNVFEYIEVFYNRFRKHASLGYKSPIQIEEKFYPHGGKEPSMAA